MTKAKSGARKPMSDAAKWVMDNWDNKKHQPYATVKSFQEVKDDLADIKTELRNIARKVSRSE